MKTAFIYDQSMAAHVLRSDHPMKPIRIKNTYELLCAYGAFDLDHYVVRPRPATEGELQSFHTLEYISAVESISQGLHGFDPSNFNFSLTGDNPYFSGMYESALISTGASIVGAELLWEGTVDRAFNIGGGLHHAAADKASGFCVFNDPVIAINYFLNRGMRVAYIDIDCHHGDGVQNAYYDSDQVLTISIHESGKYLFPGTGFPDENGVGPGRGYSVNIPLFPFTDDETYLKVFRELIIPIVQAFAPDVITTQLGIDTHYKDPITHLQLTSKAFSDIVKEFANFKKPWLAMGGGGYDISAVARCWTLAYGVMIDRDWPNDIPLDYARQNGFNLLRDEYVPCSQQDLREQIEKHTCKVSEEVKASIFSYHGL